MEFIRNVIKELSTLYGIMLYSILVNFFDASFLLVDVIMLGRLGKGHLSAAFLSFAFYNICWYLLEGMLTAEDDLLSRAFHLHDLVSVRYWTYISFIVVIILCLVTTILFIFSAVIIQFIFSIPQHIAIKSAEFLFLLLPGFFFHALYRVVQKYLHSQQDTRIPLICGGIGVVSNIIGTTLSVACSLQDRRLPLMQQRSSFRQLLLNARVRTEVLRMWNSDVHRQAHHASLSHTSHSPEGR